MKNKNANPKTLMISTLQIVKTEKVQIFFCPIFFSEWTLTSSPMSDKRRFSASTFTASNQLFVTGGEFGKVRLNSVEIFDQNYGWKSEQPLPETVSKHCLVPFDSGFYKIKIKMARLGRRRSI